MGTFAHGEASGATAAEPKGDLPISGIDLFDEALGGFAGGWGTEEAGLLGNIEGIAGDFGLLGCARGGGKALADGVVGAVEGDGGGGPEDFGEEFCVGSGAVGGGEDAVLGELLFGGGGEEDAFGAFLGLAVLLEGLVV